MAWNGSAVTTGFARPAVRLPGEVTSYVGRGHEMSEVRRLLGSGRLVTLTGAGGVGKTRLAMRMAGDLRGEFADGVQVVRLAELRDADLLAGFVAGELGIRSGSKRPVAEVVIAHLRNRRMLLVLDNCEHVLRACAEFVGAVLERCREVRVLATSRQSLGVPGEQLLIVPPLPVPDGEIRSRDELEGYDGARLFVDRATAVLPSFALTDDNYAAVASLCRQLDGLPLAIELAAVRLRALSLGQLAERLSARLELLTTGRRTAPDRQRTLLATVEWSFELCSPAEQLVWVRASVFAGAFDLAAAEQVCAGDGVDEAAVLDVIDGLLDKSVLVREEPTGRTVRYRMLEALREYGQDLLDETGDRLRVARLHRDWYADVCVQAAADWSSPRQREWVDRIRRDYANLRVAHEFCLSEPGEAVVGLQMQRDLAEYMLMDRPASEASAWIDRALSLLPDDEPMRTTGLRLRAWIALFQADAETAAGGLVEAGELAKRFDDAVEAAYVRAGWGIAALFTDHPTKAVPLLEKALATFQAHGEERGEAVSRFCYGLAVGLSGDLDKGRAEIEQEIARCVAVGDVQRQAWALFALAYLEMSQGDAQVAEETGRRCLRLLREIDNLLVKAFTLDTLAIIAGREGDHVRAVTLFGIGDAVWERMDVPPASFPALLAHHQDQVDVARRVLGATVFDKVFAEGRAQPSERAVRSALGEEPTDVTVLADDRGGLTRRESEVAALVARGLTNQQIAQALAVSRRTAETHVEHILTKLGFSTRTQIAAWHVDRNPAT